jgi:dCTP deaminase
VGTHRHHKDFDRLNNNPWNIERMAERDHIRLHNEHNYGAGFDAEAHSLAIRASLERLAADDEWYTNYCEAQSVRAQSFWHDPKYKDARAVLLESRETFWATDEARQGARDRQIAYWKDNTEAREVRGEASRLAWARASSDRRAEQAEIMRLNMTKHNFTGDDVKEALHQTGSIRGAARLLGCDRSVFRRFPEVVNEFRGARKVGKGNHKVVGIREIAGDHDVYCLTVPEAGNFALTAGVFVQNCGIVTNFTPLEAGWEGHITIEISNTTPLPARIYAKEGIAQILFFESDQDCKISYADRAGKYQGQRGITTARI